MSDPGQLFYGDDSLLIYKNGGRHPFEAFSKNGGEHPYISTILLQNLYNQQPPAVLTKPVQTAVLSMLTMYRKQAMTADLMCISETGSGKTYAFLIPAIQTALNRIEKNKNEPSKSPSVLIFCHSQPLAEHIYSVLLSLVKGMPLQTCLIVGKTEFLKSGEFDIGVCCAGRFRSHFEGTKRVAQVNVSKVELLIIDEVDDSMRNAEDFELYHKIRQKTTCPAYFFSATMECSFSMGDIFHDENSFCYQHGELNRLPENVQAVFWECDKSMLPEVYLDLDGSIHDVPDTSKGMLQKSNPSDMVYFIMKLQWTRRVNTKFMVFTRKTTIADFLADKLTLLGIDARAIHAKKSVEERRQSLLDFKADVFKVLIGTNQLTRGIDVDIQVVINYDVPTSHTTWIHRSGRAGRNMKHGVVITLVDPKDHDYETKKVLRDIVANFPNEKRIPAFLKSYIDF